MSCTAERERKGTTGHVTRIGPFEAFWEYMLDRAIITTAINPGPGRARRCSIPRGRCSAWCRWG